MVNATEAAAICGLPRQNFYYYWRKVGGLECARLGGKPYFDRASVQAWAKSLSQAVKRRGKQ